jgi:hypothetical protein
MEQLPFVNLVVEGLVDEVIIRKVLAHIGIACGFVRGRNGKQEILNNLHAYNNAAKTAYWLVVVDLDDEACVKEFVTKHLPNPEPQMFFRVAVREIEAWLLADKDSLAKYLTVPVENFPDAPDDEADPKDTLVGIVRKKCRKTDLREDIIPSPTSGKKVGKGYLSRITEFVESWRPEIAAERSESLRRCIKALEKLKNPG